MGNTTTCKIVPPKNIILKLCTRNYVGELTRHANLGYNWYSGSSPQMGEILPPCDFLTVLSYTVLSCAYHFSRSCTQVEPLDWTDFHAL